MEALENEASGTVNVGSESESVRATRGGELAVGWGSRVRSAEASWTAPAVAELPAAEADGIVSRLLLGAVSGGQPLLLTRRGRPAAVLCDPDTWAELEQLAGESLEASA